MKFAWKFLGLTAAVLAVSPAALAHELACEKTVNGETLLELDKYPATLTYQLTIDNIHPTSASDVLQATDPMFDTQGNPVFQTPFTIPFQGSVTKEETVQVGSYEACLRLAGDDGAEDDYIDNVFTVRWDSGSDVCTARVHCVNPTPPPPGEDTRRMTGGGSVFGTGPNRVTHGFELRCDSTDPRQNLEVNWDQHQFHLTALDSALCFEDPHFSEGQPVAGFNTYVGTATGRYDGVDGATISFTFTDHGEPGKNDTAAMTIKDVHGTTVLSVSGKLKFGNQQAHP